MKSFFDRLTSDETPFAAQFVMHLLGILASSRPSEGEESDDHESVFVVSVVEILFYVSFVCKKTRRECCTHGCQAFETISKFHPVIISVVISSIEKHMDTMDKASTSAIKSLRFDNWIPTRNDLHIIRRWLKLPRGSFCHELVRILLNDLDFDAEAPAGEDTKRGGDSLLVPVELQRQIGIILADAHAHHLLENTQAQTSTQMIDYVVSIFGMEPASMTIVSLCWKTAMRLHLYNSRSVYTYNDDPVKFLFDNVQGTVKSSLCSYMRLFLTSECTSHEDFTNQGVEDLKILLNDKQYVPILKCAIDLILPLTAFTPSGRRATLMAILYRAVRGAKEVAAPLILHSIRNAAALMRKSRTTSSFEDVPSLNMTPTLCVVEFWMRVLTSGKDWWTHKMLRSVVDKVIEASIDIPSAFPILATVLEDSMTQALQAISDQPKSLFDNVLSLLSKPPVISFASLEPETHQSEMDASEPYLGLVSLYVDMLRQKKDWLSLGALLVSHNSFSSAMRKVKMEIYQLTLYRWIRYFERISPESSAAVLHAQMICWLFFSKVEVGGQSQFFGFLFMEKEKQLSRSLVAKFQSLCEFHEGEGHLPDLEPSTRRHHADADAIFKTFRKWVEEKTFRQKQFSIEQLPQAFDQDRLYSLLLTNFYMKSEASSALWVQHVTVPLDDVRQEHAEFMLKKTKIGLFTHPMHYFAGVGHASRISQLSRVQQDRTEEHHNLTSKSISMSSLEDSRYLTEERLLSQDVVIEDIGKIISTLLQTMNEFQDREFLCQDLDSAYIQGVSLLYPNQSKTITSRLSCNRAKGCNRPANVVLTSQQFVRDESVHDQLESNRSQFNQCLQDALPSKNVVKSALQLYQFMVDIVEYQGDKWFLALGFFTRLMDAMEAEMNIVLKLTPIHELFELCFETITTKIIQFSPQGMVLIPETCFSHPLFTDRLAPLFYPNQQPETFPQSYVVVSGRLDESSANTVKQLLSCFDVSTFLATVGQSGVEDMINSIQRGMQKTCVASSSISSSEAFNSPVLEEYRGVFGIHTSSFVDCLRFQFPKNFHTLFRFLITASRDRSADPSLWDAFLGVLSGLGSNYQLNRFQCADALHHINGVLMEDRKQRGCLPSRWGVYIAPIAKLLSFFLSVCLQDFSMARDEKRQLLLETMNPWLESFSSSTTRDPTNVPWLNIEKEKIGIKPILALAIESFRLIYASSSESNDSHFIHAIWEWYFHSFATVSVPHVLDGVHAVLLSVPGWDSFRLSFENLGDMYQLVSEFPSECHVFVWNLCMQLPLSNLIDHIHHLLRVGDSQQAESLGQRFINICLQLLNTQSLVGDRSDVADALVSLEFAPGFLSDFNFDGLVQWARHQCNASGFLVQNTTTTYCFDVLNKLGGIDVSEAVATLPALSIESSINRLHQILSANVHMLSANEDKPPTPETFAKFQRKYLEACLLRGDPVSQHRTQVALFKAVLHMGNSSVFSSARVKLMEEAIVSFVSENPLASLVLLEAAPKSMSHPHAMAKIMETAVEAYMNERAFLGEGGTHAWLPVVHHYHTPGLLSDEFFNACTKYGLVYLLYIELLRGTQLGAGLQHDRTELDKLLRWLEHLELVNVVPSQKLYLLWMRAFRLLLDLEEDGESPLQLSQMLGRLRRCLKAAADDKAFSFIGLFANDSKLDYPTRIAARYLHCVATLMTGPHSLRLQHLPATPVPKEMREEIAHLDKSLKLSHYKEFENQTQLVRRLVSEPVMSREEIKHLLHTILVSMFKQFSFARAAVV
eukprot:m.176748 g.176748  ORF g.176748 m.176748 type:complete len:1762 (+) comp13536_c1_seq1:1668-6953(+)